MNEIVGKRDDGRLAVGKGDSVESYAVAADAFGPKVCFSMEHMKPAEMRQFMAEASRVSYATRGTGDRKDARHSDQGVTVGWSERQHEAARRLEDMWISSLKGYTGPGGYRSGGDGASGMSTAELEEAGQATAQYRDAARAVERDCGVEYARALRMAVIEHQPSSLHVAGLVRQALTFLADFWGL